jgi:hypothetical protein
MSDEQTIPASPPKPAKTLAREARLAAQLRENLRRRKAQARAQSADVPAPPSPNSDDESGGLPKPSPES